MKTEFVQRVLVDGNARPILVFAKGRIKYHAVAALDATITLVSLDSLRGYRELLRKGEPYPPRRAASFWLNHDTRTVTKRASAVLKGIVSRKKGNA